MGVRHVVRDRSPVAIGVVLFVTLLGSVNATAATFGAETVSGRARSSLTGLPSQSSSPVSPSDYVDAVCAAISGVGKDIKSKENDEKAQLQATQTISDARTVLVGFLQQVSDDVNQRVQQVGDAGIPRISHGAAVAHLIFNELNGFGQQIANTVNEARALPDDPTGFESGARAIATRANNASRQVNKDIAKAKRRYNVSVLDSAFHNDPTCSGL
jgi:hypothetical protein